MVCSENLNVVGYTMYYIQVVLRRDQLDDLIGTL